MSKKIECGVCGENEGEFTDPEYSGDKICRECAPGRYDEVITDLLEEIDILKKERSKILDSA